MAPGGCGYPGPRVVGQPAAAAIAGLRGRPAVAAAIQPRASQVLCPNNNSPDRSASPENRRGAHASLLHLCAGAEDSLPRRLWVLVSYTTLALQRFVQQFLRITRNRGLVHFLSVIKQLLCCARDPLHPVAA